MADVSDLVTDSEEKTNSTHRVKELPNGAFLSISPRWRSAINVTNSQQPDTSLPTTLAFEDVPVTSRITSIFVIIDYSKGKGTNTSAVELLLSFCTREYNTVVTNGRASTNETAVVTAPQSNATLSPDHPAHFDLSWIFLGYARSENAVTDISDLFAQAVYNTPGDMAQLFSIMKNVATSLTNMYISSVLNSSIEEFFSFRSAR
jgi:hypothetical protein